MTPWLDDGDVRLYLGDNLDVLRQLPDRSVHMCATSPPFYGLRDYGTDGQIGLEDTPDEWVARLVAVFREVRRVLRDDGTLWVEIGDSYGTSGDGGTGPTSAKQNTNRGSNHDGGRHVTHPTKPKDLLGQPWLLAFALRADGWYLRSEIIWARPNPMPESVTDRPTKSHSTVFLLSKQPRYFYDADAIRETYKYDGRKVLEINGTSEAAHENYANREGKTRWPGGVDGGANARSVWNIPTQPTPFAHFATWPEALVRRMILAGTSERGCCPECGSPWTRDTEVTHGPDKSSEWHVTAMAGVMTGGVGKNFREVSRRNVGWSPGCSCIDERLELDEPDEPSGVPFPTPVPCIVLDPFAGSATTMLVARNHGRHSIGIELNEDYLQIAAKRLQQLSLFSSPHKEMDQSPSFVSPSPPDASRSWRSPSPPTAPPPTAGSTK